MICPTVPRSRCLATAVEGGVSPASWTSIKISYNSGKS